MVRIRLSRTGSKKQPSYRVVVSDADFKRDGRVVERIGHYNPRRDPIEYRIDEDRALYWLSVGAQPSDAVRRLLVKQGTLDRLTRLRTGEKRDNLVAEFLGLEVTDEALSLGHADAEDEVESGVVAQVLSELEEEE